MFRNPRHFFLLTIIAALSAGALTGIGIFLFGRFGDLEIRLLLSTLILSGFSFCGLCCASLLDRESQRLVAVAGMGVAAVGFVINFIGVWGWWDTDWTWRVMASLIVASVSFAQACLLLRLSPATRLLRYALAATLGFIGLTGLLLVGAILHAFENGEFYFRLLGTAAILDVLGSVVTPIAAVMQRGD